MSLRNKLLLSFLVTTLLPVLIIGFVYYQKTSASLRQARIEGLETIADLKVAKIEDFFKRRMEDMKTVQSYHHVKTDLPALIQFGKDTSAPEYLLAKDNLDDHLKIVQEVYGYLDVMLVDTRGRIVYVSNEAHHAVDLGKPLPDPGNLAFENGKNVTYLTDPFRNERESDIPFMLISAPLHDVSGKWIGVAAFEMNMAAIYELVQDTSGLGETGETLIGKRAGGDVLFLNPLRHDKTTALHKRITIGGDDALPIQYAVQGLRGSGVSMDYRHEEILAAWRPIPLLGWGMAAKIDTDEAFAAISEMERFLSATLLLAVLFGGVVFTAIARSITGPIRSIERGMDIVKKGGLEHHIESTSKTEVAPLVGHFNEMIGEIKRRTKDLSDFKFALDASSIVSITDANGVIQYVNEQFCKSSQYSESELVGQDHKILSSGTHSKRFIKEMWDTILKGEVWRGQFKNKAKDGSFFWVDTTIVPFLNQAGEPYQYVSIRTDITERKRIEEEFLHMAHYDHLTGLPNRVLFQDRLDQTLKSRRGGMAPFAVMFLDLDQFKMINDTLGHSAGDQLLKTVSGRLQRCIRAEDTVARMGGDEFTVLLPTIAKKEDVFLVAEKMIEALKKPVNISGQELFVTGSIGISLYPDHGRNTEALMKNADTAMYHAKEQGRGKFTFYSAVPRASETRRLSLIYALSRAIEREELLLYYQPIVELNKGRVTGMEALIRWKREGGDLVPPSEFIPLAEQSGLILPIGEWVMEKGIKQLKTWRRDGLKGLTLSVNVSAPQFQEKDFVVETGRIMRENKIEKDMLKLEMTESILMKNKEEIAEKLSALKDLGIRLSIDDFGTGFSSLSYLKRFPIDVLKVDQSFVRGLPDDREDAAITNMILALATELGIDVVAEGIETAEQLQYLRKRRCAKGQGYLFSRPLPGADFTRLLKTTVARNGIAPKLFRVAP